MIKSRELNYLKLILSATLVLGACGKSDDDKNEHQGDSSQVQISPSLIRLNPNQTTLIGRNPLRRLVDSEYLTTDVTIHKLKYPITNVTLSDADPAANSTATGKTSFQVYKCAESTVEGCLVDLTGTALQNLLTNAKGAVASVGTFTQVSIGSCTDNGAATDVYFVLNAEVTISGVKYYTHPTDGLSSTGPAQDIKIQNRGGCGTVSFLPDPLIVTKESIEVTQTTDDNGNVIEPTVGKLTGDVPLHLYFDLTNAVYASGGTTNTGAGTPTNNCLAKSAQAPYICLNFPKVIGTTDTGTPTVSRMLMNDYTIWGFYSGKGAIPFGAYQRIYYESKIHTGTLPTTLMGPDFKKPKRNSDGTYLIETYNDGRYMKVTNFKLETHSGTVDVTGTATPYTAKKM